MSNIFLNNDLKTVSMGLHKKSRKLLIRVNKISSRPFYFNSSFQHRRKKKQHTNLGKKWMHALAFKFYQRIVALFRSLNLIKLKIIN